MRREPHQIGPEGPRGEGDIAVLAGEGPHVPVAAKRGTEFAAANGATLTLVNGRTGSDEENEYDDYVEAGLAVIEAVAGRVSTGSTTRRSSR